MNIPELNGKFLAAALVGFVIGFTGSMWLLQQGRPDILVLVSGGLVAAIIWCVHLLRRGTR